MKKQFFFFVLLMQLLQSCGGDPVSNKIAFLLIVPFLGGAFIIGGIVMNIINGSDDDSDSGTFTRFIVGGIVMLILYSLFKGCA